MAVLVLYKDVLYKDYITYIRELYVAVLVLYKDVPI